MIKRLTGAQNKAASSEHLYTKVRKKERVPFTERLTRNAVLGALILLCITAVSTATQGGGSLLTAVQHSLDEDWDERLGRLTFVSAMFPDAVQVFFSSNDDILCAPCTGTIVHAWSKDEPYIGYGVYDRAVYPAMAGTVVGIGHGQDEEKILRVSHDNGLETVYYNLSALNVAEGDAVSAQTQLGTAMEGRAVFLEVRREGIAIDPSDMLVKRSAP